MAKRFLNGINPGTLLAAGSVVGLNLTSDLTTTSTTIIDATGLLATVPAGTYLIDAYLIDQAAGTAVGPRFGVGGTATASVSSFTVEQATSTTAKTTTVGTAVNTLYGANIGTANTSFSCNVHAVVTVTAAGTLGVRWGSSTNAVTMTLKAGSYVLITRIA